MPIRIGAQTIHTNDTQSSKTKTPKAKLDQQQKNHEKERVKSETDLIVILAMSRSRGGPEARGLQDSLRSGSSPASTTPSASDGAGGGGRRSRFASGGSHRSLNAVRIRPDKRAFLGSEDRQRSSAQRITIVETRESVERERERERN